MKHAFRITFTGVIVIIMDNNYLPSSIFKGIFGHNIDSYLISLEGWRRGLTLTWYREQTPLNPFNHTTDTAMKLFSLESKNGKKHFFYRSRGDLVANESTQIGISKQETKEVLELAGIRTPEGGTFTIQERENILKCANDIKYPVVIKPLSESMGRGVFTDINSDDELNEILDHYETSRYKNLILEKHYFGNEYRIYVVGDEAISCVYRERASIIGDGEKTIEQLITDKNKLRKKNPNLKNKLIKVDYDITRQLTRQGLMTSSIPDKGEQIFLRSTSNLSIGGEPFDVTDEVTDEIKALAVNSLKAIGNMPHAGVDVIIDPEDPTQGVIIELNPTAGITFHVYPFNGEMRDVPARIIDYYFPETKDAPKNNFIFNYKEATDILKDAQYNHLEIAPCPSGDTESTTVIMRAKSISDARISRIKRSALICQLNGEIKRLDKGTISLKLVISGRSRFELFLKRMKRRYPDYTIGLTHQPAPTEKNLYFYRGITIK